MYYKKGNEIAELSDLLNYSNYYSSCGKVMFSQASVCPQGEGVCLWVWGCTPPLGRHPLGRHPLGRHPPRQTPPRQMPPGQTLPPPPSPETATVADGTHPTGMHSCFVLNLTLPYVWHIDIKQMERSPRVMIGKSLWDCARVWFYELLVTLFNVTW